MVSFCVLWKPKLKLSHVTPNILWHTYFAIPADSITVAASAKAYWLKANSYRLLLQPATATGHWPWLLLLLLATRAALAPAPAPAVATAAVAASGMPACLPVCLAACLIACLRASLSDWLLDWLADCLAEPRWRTTAKPAEKPHGGFLYKRVTEKTRELSSETHIPCLRKRFSRANEAKKHWKSRRKRNN